MHWVIRGQRKIEILEKTEIRHFKDEVLKKSLTIDFILSRHVKTWMYVASVRTVVQRTQNHSKTIADKALLPMF